LEGGGGGGDDDDDDDDDDDHDDAYLVLADMVCVDHHDLCPPK